jgi:hypothetical protein
MKTRQATTIAVEQIIMEKITLAIILEIPAVKPSPISTTNKIMEPTEMKTWRVSPKTVEVTMQA